MGAIVWGIIYPPPSPRIIVDITKFHACDNDLNTLIIIFEHGALLVIECFENNVMKPNGEKCHLLVSGHKLDSFWVKMMDKKVWEIAKQKLLTMAVGGNLNYDKYLVFVM